ncbi:hypothetical protein CCHR01_03354 [Colletotrichum chrysophilum]|uniref:Uncharacterized protein n=1 Tax=Colletotrichum chrysophilum TaxID=1836956 RepID=A0AAD9AVB6_9PEZI|nr:hypothetical protein CCHR01_03354 [Colletotrichum chrysophilum]
MKQQSGRLNSEGWAEKPTQSKMQEAAKPRAILEVKANGVCSGAKIPAGKGTSGSDWVSMFPTGRGQVGRCAVERSGQDAGKLPIFYTITEAFQFVDMRKAIQLPLASSGVCSSEEATFNRCDFATTTTTTTTTTTWVQSGLETTID